MKYLSLRLIFLCVFLPPVLYIYTLQAAESILSNQWKTELEQEVISDPQSLLQGRVKLEEHISRNIQDFVQGLWLVKLGVKPRILVRTGKGHTIYPFIEVRSFLEQGSSQDLSSLESDDASQISAHNLKLLKQGLVVGLSVHIGRDSWLANIILVVYILFFSSLLVYRYVMRAREVEEQTRLYQSQLMHAQEQVTAAEQRLQELRSKEDNLARDVEDLKQELKLKGQELQGAEEEALAELEEMEAKLRESEDLRKAQQDELYKLQEESVRLQASPKQSSSKQKKAAENVSKRFSTLYKNLLFDTRAIEGYLNLSEDMQIKAEECIHNLNHDSNLIKTKRKVFIRKGSSPVFESEFAYKGRIYWCQEESGKIRIVTVGTKNTQSKDMKYIDSIT